jgi:hypothetical protein
MMPCNEDGCRLDVLPDPRIGQGSVARGAVVSLFDPQGRYLGDGTMGAIRGEEIRIDVDRCDATEVAYVVAMDAEGDAVRVFIRHRPGVAQAPGGGSTR